MSSSHAFVVQLSRSKTEAFVFANLTTISQGTHFKAQCTGALVTINRPSFCAVDALQSEHAVESIATCSAKDCTSSDDHALDLRKILDAAPHWFVHLSKERTRLAST